MTGPRLLPILAAPARLASSRPEPLLSIITLHICSACGGSNHSNGDCANVDRERSSAKKCSQDVDILENQVITLPPEAALPLTVVDNSCCYDNSLTPQADGVLPPPFCFDDPVAVTTARDNDAILYFNSADASSPSPTDIHQGSRNELIDSNHVVFTTPSYDDIPSIAVYADCILGACGCSHAIGDVPAQLKPCRAAPFLLGVKALDVSCDERAYLWKGIVCGFDIVDSDCPTGYHCDNYDSILAEQFHSEMTELLTKEISEHKVSIVDTPPRCVHSLGAVVKSNGKLCYCLL